MKTVFISASFPDPERLEESGPSFPADIAAAAAATIEATLRSGARLLFGGHPTINPLVLNIASMLSAGPQVTIYQSEFFRSQFSDEVERLVNSEGATVHFTPTGRDRDESLKTFREAMLAESIDAAFFIGGMSGIGDEFAILKSSNKRIPCLMYSDPGGFASRLIDGLESDPEASFERQEAMKGRITSDRILRGRAYGSLALRSLADLNIGVPRPTDEL